MHGQVQSTITFEDKNTKFYVNIDVNTNQSLIF